MSLSLPNQLVDEIPENIRRGLLAKAEGRNWEECAEIAKISRYEMQRWRKHPDADNLISTAINYKLEETIGIISNAAPALAHRLVDIAMNERTRPYTAVDAIKTCLAFLQTGVIDRENKTEIKKIRRALEQLEGEPSDIVDI